VNGFGLFEILSGLLTFFYSAIPSYGLAIILLTLTTRIILLPLSIKQTRSMREMQVIQPQVKALQKKHKGDRQKLNEEMMKLYKEHGVNPLGGCLPLVLQMPILIGLFYVIRSPLSYLGFSAPENGSLLADFVPQNVSGILERLQESALATDLHEHAVRVHSFLIVRLECSPVDAISSRTSALTDQACGSGALSAIPYLLLLAFMGFTTWYQQKQMQASRGNDPQAQQLQLMGKIMPAFLIFIGFSFPAGVLIYWFASNVWTIVQQRIILKAAPPILGSGDPVPAKAVVGKRPKERSGKGSPAKATGSKPAAGKGNGAARPKSSKPHPSSKKKKR
jgi:YidC/Oxa1 family membrane protein insertase